MHRHLAHRVRGQLVAGVEGAALGFAEADGAAAKREDRGARGLGEGDVRVVFGGHDVQVVGLGGGGEGAGAGGGFGVGGGEEVGDAGLRVAAGWALRRGRGGGGGWAAKGRVASSGGLLGDLLEDGGRGGESAWRIGGRGLRGITGS